MKLVIAEKPELAKDIARAILHNMQLNDDVMYDDTYTLSLENRDKIINNLVTVGTKDNKWKQNTSTGTDKHCFNLFLPIGVTDIYEGNHSVFSGIVKGVGELTFYPGDVNHGIYDISYLYDKIYYDGYSYRTIKGNKIICSALFEYGCLFEIGRIINKANISFLKMKQNEYEQLK